MLYHSLDKQKITTTRTSQALSLSTEPEREIDRETTIMHLFALFSSRETSHCPRLLHADRPMATQYGRALPVQVVSLRVQWAVRHPQRSGELLLSDRRLFGGIRVHRLYRIFNSIKTFKFNRNSRCTGSHCELVAGGESDQLYRTLPPRRPGALFDWSAV